MWSANVKRKCEALRGQIEVTESLPVAKFWQIWHS